MVGGRREIEGMEGTEEVEKGLHGIKEMRKE